MSASSGRVRCLHVYASRLVVLFLVGSCWSCTSLGAAAVLFLLRYIAFPALCSCSVSAYRCHVFVRYGLASGCTWSTDSVDPGSWREPNPPHQRSTWTTRLLIQHLDVCSLQQNSLVRHAPQQEHNYILFKHKVFWEKTNTCDMLHSTDVNLLSGRSASSQYTLSTESRVCLS